MRPSSRFFLLGAFGLLALLFTSHGVLAQAPAVTAGEPVALMVELRDPPATAAYAAYVARQEPAAALASNAVAAATAAAQAQLATITAAQTALQQQLAALDTPVLFSVQRVYNGVAVLADETQRAAIAQLPGVQAVHPLVAKEPGNSTSIPFLGVPALWQAPSTLGVAGDLHGEGIRIAVADTGIDYLHRDFAGPGTGYGENDRTRIGDVLGYPGPRVAGGYDFAGDDYNASANAASGRRIPHPDPDPMDCYGHGTHVAGTAAGSGVTQARTTYPGPYDGDTDYASLYIGPGVAPRASLYALKIFGCYGSTNLTDLALEWAVDPNQDGDFGDHLDVINLSLGSAYGWEYDTSAVSANNAALAGVIVVASGGNNGDIQLITSAPGSADRAISVAATQHAADVIAPFSSRGPRRGDAGLKPDVAAPGTSIVSAKAGSGTDRASSSGTSMAAPHVAGIMALLRQAHPDWSVEELKALAMNSAVPLVARGQEPLSPPLLPVRTGAGRIDPQVAIAASTVLYAADGSGRVSLSFGTPEVAGDYAVTREVEIANKAGAPAWYEVTYNSLSDMPGVFVHTPDAALLVPAGSTARVPITLRVDAAQFRRHQGAADAGSYLLTTWFAEEGGQLYAWPGRTLQTAPLGSAAVLAASYQPHAQTLAYTITFAGGVAPAVTSATLSYGKPGDKSIVLADLAPLPQAGASIAGSLQLGEDGERWLAAGLLHIRLAGGDLGEEGVGGQLFFAQPVLHLPLYAAPRLAAGMRVAPQALTLMSGTVQSLTFAGSSLQGSVPPTDIVSLAAVMELKLRSPNIRPDWLDYDTPDRHDHADLQYVGVTSDMALGLPVAAADSRIYFGITTWADWSTPSEITVNILLDTNGDGHYDYRLANGVPTAPIFGRELIGPLVSELYDISSGQFIAQQPLNGVAPEQFDTGLFFNNVMIMPARLADLGLSAAGGNIGFMVQTASTDTLEGEDRYIDRSPLLSYNPARPALLFSAPNAAVPMYLDRPSTAVEVTVNPAGYPYNPVTGVLVLHHHNGDRDRAQIVDVDYRWPAVSYLPFVGQRAEQKPSRN